MSETSILSSQKSSPSKPPSRRKTQTKVPASTTAPLTGIDYIRQVLYTMKEFGVIEFKQGDLHLKLSPAGPTTLQPDKESPDVAGPPLVELSNEDLLFWSSDPLEPEPKEGA